MLPLTVDTLRAAYDYLATTPPFNKWNLPEGEDVTFKVARTTADAAWCTRDYERKTFIIAISAKRTAQTGTLMEHMAHEIIHVYQMSNGMHSSADHNTAYRKLAKQVCKFHGFDINMFY